MRRRWEFLSFLFLIDIHMGVALIPRLFPADAQHNRVKSLHVTPSFEVFQLLPDSIPENKSIDIDDDDESKSDTLTGLSLSDFQGGLGEKRLESLPDPFQLVENDLEPLSDAIEELVSSEQPMLVQAASQFLQKKNGKRALRPTIVQLVSRMVLEEDQRPRSIAEDIERRQLVLGQIVEMIHVANRIHDDVLNEDETKANGGFAQALYNNKVAVLIGDYLLSRASVLLARLENTVVVELIATALESLILGEVMQTEEQLCPDLEPYLRKNYYQTASLICYACRSAAILGGHSPESKVAKTCEEFGFHLGLAMKVWEDSLDWKGLNGLLRNSIGDESSLYSAPTLYAAEEYPKLRSVIKRGFQQKGDHQFAIETTRKSSKALGKADSLAFFHAQKAVRALLRLPESNERNALVRLTCDAVYRKGIMRD